MNKVYLMNIFGIFGLFLFQLFLVVTGINSSLTKKKRKKLGIKNKMKTMYRFSCLWIFKLGKTFVFYKLLVIYIYLLFFINLFFLYSVYFKRCGGILFIEPNWISNFSLFSFCYNYLQLCTYEI